MKLLNPYGLLILIGIPVLILIYLIRSRREEKAVSSTFIWKLSEKKFKNRLPFQKIRKILLFALQVLSIVALAVIASKPMLLNNNCIDYIVIVDTSASMESVDTNGITKLDKAKAELEKLSYKADNGHKISVIVASANPYIAAEGSTDRRTVGLIAKHLGTDNSACNTEAAFALAGDLTNRTVNPEIIFYTDLEFVPDENMVGNEIDISHFRAVDLSSDDDLPNISITSLKYDVNEEIPSFVGSIFSDGRDGVVSVGLLVDGELIDAKSATCKSGEETTVVFPYTANFLKAEIYIDDFDVAGNDALQSDNRYSLCLEKGAPRTALVVSGAPFYYEKIIKNMFNFEVDVLSELPSDDISGYDLYIFDKAAPENLPENASVLFVCPEDFPDIIANAGESDAPSYITVNHDVISGGESDWMVSEYNKYTLAPSYKALLTAGEDCVFAIAENDGCYRAVMAFELQDSNLSLKASFLSFFSGIIDEMAPPFVGTNSVTLGDKIRVYSEYDDGDVFLTYPNGSESKVSLISSSAYLTPADTGVYTVTFRSYDSEDNNFHADFFAHIPFGEGVKGSFSGAPAITPMSSPSEASEPSTADFSLPCAIFLLIIIIADWGVYYYEQY